MVYIRVHSFLFFCMHRTACGILVPRPRIKPMPSAVRVQFQPLDHPGSPLEFTLDVVHSIGLDKDIFKKSREGKDSCIKSQPFFFPILECSVTQSCLTLTLACSPQAPLFMGFPCQEDWNVLPLPSPGDLSFPGIQLTSPALQANPLPLSHWRSPSNSTFSFRALENFENENKCTVPIYFSVT